MHIGGHARMYGAGTLGTGCRRTGCPTGRQERWRDDTLTWRGRNVSGHRSCPPRQMYIRPRYPTILEPYRPEMLKNILLVVSALAVARAQIPNLGWCPDYSPMVNFDMGKYMGVWYEAERYFQLSEVVSRCVMANYTKGPDGKLRVSNEVTNRFTGIKRILEGEIKTDETKSKEGKLHVKYTTIPLTPETQYSVLETDYENYAVLWSCSGIGPIHAQSAWLMTRSRRPSGEILQKAYGVLDKYKISKTFFVKTDQDDCAYLDAIAEPAKPDKKPAEKPTEEATVEEAPEETTGEEAQAPKSAFNLRFAITPDAPAIIIETRKSEIAAAEAAAASKEPEVQPEAKPEVLIAEPVEALLEPEKELNTVEKVAEPEVAAPPASVPEVILKAADRAKEVVKSTVPEVQNLQPEESINETLEKSDEQSEDELSKPAKQLPEALQKPLQQLQEALQKPAAQFQEFIHHPVQQFQAALQGPIQQFQAAIQGPVDKFHAAFQPKPEAPAAEKPAAEKPAAEKPAAEKPAAEKPAAEKPAAEVPQIVIPAFELKEQALDAPAEVAPEKLPEETLVASPEAPKEEENKNDVKKIES